MTFLITGSTGFVGSNFLDMLLEKNDIEKIYAVKRSTSNLKWVKKALENKKVEWIDIDKLPPDELKSKLPDVDFVYHIAGVLFAKKKDDYIKGNVELTKNILNAYKEKKNLKRFIYISSLAAAGPKDEPIPRKEEEEPNPVSYYGESKLLAEKEVIKSGLPYTILRPPIIYGPRDKDFLTFIKTVKSGIIPVLGFTERIVDIIHVYDLIENMYKVANCKKCENQIYFISEKGYTWEELGKITAEALGKKAIVVRIPEFIAMGVSIAQEIGSIFTGKPALLNWQKLKEGRQKYWISDTTKAREHFQMSIKYPYPEGIKQTILWLKENDLL